VLNSLLGDTFYPDYLLTEEYAGKHFVYKYAYALCTLKLKIFTYYTAFCLMHTATIASGLAFNGYDENSKNLKSKKYLSYVEKAKFNKVETVRIWDIEFSYHVKDFFDAWNISVHKWLKYYVFMRILKKGKKGVQMAPILTTFLVSAIWHGFYIGYFYFFISSALNDYTFKLGSKLYVLFGFIPTSVTRFLLL
jgi:lysophospholipid acyltransferase